jgi:divalent metal cation (Fe/Co/Zn/Cd) transporter
MMNRDMTLAKGMRLEYLTVGWNLLEAAVALITGWLAGSIALLGFGLDSVVEVSSGSVLLWRLHSERHGEDVDRERLERISLRLVGLSFLALAAYLTFDSIKSLVTHEAPAESVAGVVLAIASLLVMPLLARAKRQVARGLGSGAMHADSRQTDICAYLSAILLCGLGLNAAFGWWWADPVAALAMMPLIAREGVEAIHGKTCGASCSANHEMDEKAA